MKEEKNLCSSGSSEPDPILLARSISLASAKSFQDYVSSIRLRKKRSKERDERRMNLVDVESEAGRPSVSSKDKYETGTTITQQQRQQQQTNQDARDDEANDAGDDSMCSACCGSAASSCASSRTGPITFTSVIDDVATFLIGAGGHNERRLSQNDSLLEGSFSELEEGTYSTYTSDYDDDTRTFESYDDDDEFSLSSDFSEVSMRKKAIFSNFGVIRLRDKGPSLPVCDENEELKNADLAVPSSSDSSSLSSHRQLKGVAMMTIPMTRVMSEYSHLGSQHGEEVTEQDHGEKMAAYRHGLCTLDQEDQQQKCITEERERTAGSGTAKKSHSDSLSWTTGTSSSAARAGNKSIAEVIDLRTPKPLNQKKALNQGRSLNKRKQVENKTRVEARIAKAKKQKEAAMVQAKIDEEKRKERERQQELKRIVAAEKAKEEEERRAAAQAEAEAKRAKQEALKAEKVKRKQEKCAAIEEQKQKQKAARALEKERKKQQKEEERAARLATKTLEKEQRKIAKREKARAAAETKRLAADVKRIRTEEKTKTKVEISALDEETGTLVLQPKDGTPWDEVYGKFLDSTKKDANGDDNITTGGNHGKESCDGDARVLASSSSILDSFSHTMIVPSASLMLKGVIDAYAPKERNAGNSNTTSAPDKVLSEQDATSKELNERSASDEDQDNHLDPLSQLFSSLSEGLFGVPLTSNAKVTVPSDDSDGTSQYSDGRTNAKDAEDGKSANENDATEHPEQTKEVDANEKKKSSKKRTFVAGQVVGTLTRARSWTQSRKRSFGTKTTSKEEQEEQNKERVGNTLATPPEQSTSKTESTGEGMDICSTTAHYLEHTGNSDNASPALKLVSNKAVVYQTFNDDPENSLEVYKFISSVALPDNANDVFIKVQASTVSFSDCLIRQGLWWGSGKACLPATPGVDVVGRVCSLSQSASDRYGIQPNDYVAALIRCGGNARYVKTHASSLVRVPKEVDPASAACMVETYLTAFQSLHVGEDHDRRYRTDQYVGKSVLVIGGISMVGQAMIELAQLAGASRVYATATAKHHKFLKRIGAIPLSIGIDEWLLLPFVKANMDIIVDAYCVDHYTTTAAALKPGGKMVCIRSKPSRDEQSLIWHVDARSRTARFHGETTICTYDVYESWEANLALCQTDLTHLFRMLQSGSIKPPIADCFSLAKVSEIHQLLEARRVQGFFVCKPWLK